ATLLKQHGSVARPEGTQHDPDNNPSGRFCRFRQQRGLIACMGVSAIQVGSAASAACTYLPKLRRASAQKVEHFESHINRLQKTLRRDFRRTRRFRVPSKNSTDATL